MDRRNGAMTVRPDPRVFVLRLAAKPGVDPIRALRSLLKLALRRFGLRCVGVEELAEQPSVKSPEGS
jgi:hypothetical protein